MAEDGPWHRGSWYQESAELKALRDQAEADEVELNSLRDQMLVTPVLYIFDEMEGFSIEQVLAEATRRPRPRS